MWPRDFALDVVRRLQAAGFTALWAGGCVRDLLLGLQPDDYDIATSAHPHQVRNLFGHRRTLAVGAAFGVIVVRGPTPDCDVEVATFRTEGPYLDGRRPQHVAFSSPSEDAQRRDFTINGMFFDPLAEQVLDFVGGQADLHARLVRAIGDPHARFTEDKLRMLRAVRMTARFDFTLDPATAQAIREMAPEILVVSHERIGQELKKMLVHPRRAQAAELSRDVGLLAVILPELAPLLASPDWPVTLRRLELLSHPRFELALATLFSLTPSAPPQLDHLARRLRLSNDERSALLWLLTQLPPFSTIATEPPHTLKRLLVHPLARDLLELARVADLAAGQPPAATQFCEDFLARTPPAQLDPSPLLSGDDLIALGHTPGPAFKQLLEDLRDAQLDGLLHTPDEARAWLSRRLSG